MHTLKLLASSFPRHIVRRSDRYFHSGVAACSHIPHANAPIPTELRATPKFSEKSEDLFGPLKDGAKVFIHGSAGTPTPLLKKFYDYVIAKDLKDIKLYHVLTMGEYPFINPDNQYRFRPNSFFTDSNTRKAVESGQADYVPIFLSQVDQLFRRKIIDLDLTLLDVTPPDRHGICSLGPTVDTARAAIANSKRVVGFVNDKLPRTRGDASIWFASLTAFCKGSMACHQAVIPEPTEAERKVALLVAHNLVEDGSTIQVGIGSLPEAVLGQLSRHRNLNIHTEMFSDGVVKLMTLGAITNATKTIHPGKIVATFVMGTEKVFDFLDDNPLIEMGDASWVNDPSVIAQNPKPVSVNSCIELDITGQICSDSIGSRIYSGVGGQVDFIRGAAISLDGKGKPVIAITSTTKNGDSKIVPTLKVGSGVVTTRAHAHYVVTEYGIAYLFGRTMRQRAYELIKIAHPDHQESLEKAAHKMLGTMPSPD
ncbi:unnamed protein product [Calicophoron daubneyi]|uniref:Acetyl-CoA hydrolase n=1 Tax=Calicophoron daubneyi TaxID=300641 RepID=A0AAV2T7W4_CALDB